MNRPTLRYHGGKFKLAPWIISHFPPHRVYTEVFGGAASVLLQKPRAYAEIYNDLDGEVVNFFNILRSPEYAEVLRQQLELTPFAREEFLQAYEEAPNRIERARRMVVRSFMGFGSAAVTRQHKTGFRSNSNRSGTTPAHDWVNYPSVLPSFTERLKGVVIESRPAIQVLQTHDAPTTLHYVDPPYVHSTRNYKHRASGQVYNYEMSDENHLELGAVLLELEGMVILSGYPSPLYDELFGDWLCVERQAFADGAQERTECLWMNASAVAAQQKPLHSPHPELFGDDDQQ